MNSKPVPYRCQSCLTEIPPSYFGRLVWLEQETGPVLCRYHKGKDGKIVPVEMEPAPHHDEDEHDTRLIAHEIHLNRLGLLKSVPLESLLESLAR